MKKAVISFYFTLITYVQCIFSFMIPYYRNINRNIKIISTNTNSVTRGSLLRRSFTLSSSPLKSADATVSKEGAYVSIELYACNNEMQQLVAGQIANWAKAEHYCLAESGLQSVILVSTDGSRVAHICLWKKSNKSVFQTFDEFRKRGDKSDLPLSLKESTHLYRTVDSFPSNIATPFDDSSVTYSLDLFHAHTTAELPSILSKFQDSIIPTLRSSEHSVTCIDALHFLTSENGIMLAVLGVFNSAEGFHQLNNMKEYQQAVELAQKEAVRGTFTDIMDKTFSPRLYTLYETFENFC